MMDSLLVTTSYPACDGGVVLVLEADQLCIESIPHTVTYTSTILAFQAALTGVVFLANSFIPTVLWKELVGGSLRAESAEKVNCVQWLRSMDN